MAELIKTPTTNEQQDTRSFKGFLLGAYRSIVKNTQSLRIIRTVMIYLILVFFVIPPMLITTAFWISPFQTASFFNFTIERPTAFVNEDSRVLAATTTNVNPIVAYAATVLETQAVASVKLLRNIAPIPVSPICLPNEPCAETQVTQSNIPEPGPQGVSGNNGTNGEQGSQGSTGPQGSQGPQGGTGTVGTLTTGNGLVGSITNGDMTLNLAIATTGTTTTTNSASGLETTTAGISLIKGCNNGQVLAWNSTTEVWECTTTSDIQTFANNSDLTIISVGSTHTFSLNLGNSNVWTGLQTFNGGIEISGTVNLPTGSISNTDLANSSLTVTTGVGLSGGGTVALGSEITLFLSNIGTSGTYGSSLNIPVLTTDAQGRVTNVTNTTIAGLMANNLSAGNYSSVINSGDYSINISGVASTAVSFSGSLVGDISGTQINTSVDKIKGSTLGITTATSGNLLIADGLDWESQSMSGEATINALGGLTINYAIAQSADATHKGFLTADDWTTFNNKQIALAYTPENVTNKSVDTNLGASNTLYPSQNAVKTYIDNLQTGLIWQNPVQFIELIADTNTPVLSPSDNDIYIIDTGGNTGVWSGFNVGDAVQYQTDQWVFIKAMTVGDYFGVGFKSGVTPYSSMTGKKDNLAHITGGSPGAFTYTFIAPLNNYATFVQNKNAFYRNTSFVYSNALGEWVQLSASIAYTFGNGLIMVGPNVNLGPLTTDWNQTGLFDINTAGNININGGNLGTSATTANLFNINATTLNIGGVASVINIGSTSGTTIASNGALTINSKNDSDLTIDSESTGAIKIGTGGNAKAISIGNTNASTTLAINGGTTWSISGLGKITTIGSISTTDSGTGTITSAGLLKANNGLTVLSGGVNLPTGSISNTALANSSMTVIPGLGLSGGGTISLGSTTTISLNLGNSNVWTGLQTFNGGIITNNLSTSGTSNIGQGTGIVTINSSGALNFTSASASTWTLANIINSLNFDAGTFSIDALNNRVGIGTTAPNFGLSVVGNQAVGNIVAMTNLSSSTGPNTSILRMNMAATTGGGANSNRFVQFYSGSTTDNDGTGVGNIRLNNAGVTFGSGNADLAEWTEVAETVSYGDIISSLPTGNKKALVGNLLLGVVTDTAAFIGNETADLTGKAIVGMLGRVNTKVSTENGDIFIGDPIVASSVPGVGMKQIKAGPTIGKALAAYSGAGVNRIAVQVIPGWYDPDPLSTFDSFSIGTSGEILDKFNTIVTRAGGFDGVKIREAIISKTLTLDTDVITDLTGNGLVLSSGALTLDLGSSNVWTRLQTFNGGISTTTSTALTIDSGTNGNILIGTGANAKTLSIGNTVGATVLNLNSGTGNINFNVGGPNISGKVIIGNSGTTTPDLLVLDNGTTDPTGTNGGTYYNTVLNKFRCYENSVWKNCDASASSVPRSSSIWDTTSTTLTNSEVNILHSTAPSITPSFISNRILINGSIKVRIHKDNSTTTFRIRKGSSGCAGTQVDEDLTLTLKKDLDGYVSFSIIDAPNTTSAQSYTICGFYSATDMANTVENIQMTLIEVAASGSDLAELYTTNDSSLVPGDVVSLDSALNSGVKKSQLAYDKNVAGIISTKPGLSIGEVSNEGVKVVPVALSGRVPVKVTNENGIIKAGDYLTTSSTPGVAMKATKAGVIIGTAMTDFNGDGVGQILVFVKNGTSNGINIADLLPGLGGGENQENNSTITNLNLSEINTDRLMAGLEIITPKLTAQEIIADTVTVLKDFFANKIHTKTLCVGNEDDETCITKSQLDEIILKTISPTPTITPTPTNIPTVTITPILIATPSATPTEIIPTPTVEENPISTNSGTNL